MNILNKIAGVAICAVLLGAAGEIKPENLTASGSVGVKLTVFECGDLKIADGSDVDSTWEERKEKLTVSPCYLIQHPNGTLMWDAGIDDQLIDKPKGKSTGSFIYYVNKSLASQFEEMNIDPKTIDYIAFSHLHSDHTGNARYFENAKWLVQKNEFKLAKGGLAAMVGFVKRDYEHLIPNVELIDGHYDVFGDGSVVILLTRGHTLGHQILYVDLPETKPVILSGDLVVSMEAWRQKAPSPVDYKKHSIVSLGLLESVIEKTGAQLWVQHEKPQFDGLKKAPFAYQ